LIVVIFYNQNILLKPYMPSATFLHLMNKICTFNDTHTKTRYSASWWTNVQSQTLPEKKLTLTKKHPMNSNGIRNRNPCNWMQIL